MTDCCSEFVFSGLAPPFVFAADVDEWLAPVDVGDNTSRKEPVIGPAAAQSTVETELGKPDEVDFSRKVEKELPFLRKIVRRWHRDRANADDLVQDTVLRALSNAHLWQPGSNLRGWLLTIMRNQFLATAAKSKRSAELVAIFADWDSCLPEVSGAALVLRDVDRGMRRLSSIQRSVLQAVGVDGKSYAEVAEALGLSVGAVRCHLARARERLRAAVEGEREAAPFANRPRVGRPASSALPRSFAVPRTSSIPALPVPPPLATKVEIPSGILLGAD